MTLKAYLHTCIQCANTWNSRVQHPEKCGKCRSRFWGTPKDARYPHTCLRCKHAWQGKLSSPNKCPSCQSALWNRKKRIRRTLSPSELYKRRNL